jgi:hypothetical protein
MTMTRLAPWLLALACGSAFAQAQGSSLQACRAITDAAARLACYDALPLPAPGAPAAPAAAAAPAPAQDAKAFGFEAKTAQQNLQWVDSTIEGKFDGWRPGDRIKLANGQVWKVVDDSNAVMNLTDPKVQVRRGALGAFYLEFERSNRTARVKRVE